MDQLFRYEALFNDVVQHQMARGILLPEIEALGMVEHGLLEYRNRSV